MPPQQPAAPPQVLAPQPSPTEVGDVNALLTTLTTLRQRPALIYWNTNLGKLYPGVDLPLYDQLRTIGKVDALDLVLFTNGGDVEAPGRIIGLIREYAKKFSVLVPNRCFSAGTMTALGADDIVMTPFSALGPIDPSRSHPLLPRREGAEQPEPISVQDMRHAMQFIRESGAASGAQIAYTPEAMAEIFGALFDKIHPLAIGAIEQSYALAKLVGKRALETHMDPVKDAARITKIVDTLCDDYKSHSYQISRKEAQDLGLPVTLADAPTEAILLDIFKFYSGRPILPNNPAVGVPFVGHISWLDGAALKFRSQAQYVIGPNGGLAAQGDQWVSY